VHEDVALVEKCEEDRTGLPEMIDPDGRIEEEHV